MGVGKTGLPGMPGMNPGSSPMGISSLGSKGMRFMFLQLLFKILLLIFLFSVSPNQNGPLGATFSWMRWSFRSLSEALLSLSQYMVTGFSEVKGLQPSMPGWLGSP